MMKKLLMIFLFALSSTAYGQPWDCKKDFLDKGDSWGYEKCVVNQKIDAQNRARQEAQQKFEPLRTEAHNDVVAQALNYVSGKGEDADDDWFYYPVKRNNGNCIFKSTQTFDPDIDLNKGNPKAIEFFTRNTQWGQQLYISRVEGLPEFRCNGCNGDRVQRAWALIYKECKGTRKAF